VGCTAIAGVVDSTHTDYSYTDYRQLYHGEM
jgi:hypothetical protein